jgi:hypothetical protein
LKERETTKEEEKEEEEEEGEKATRTEFHSLSLTGLEESSSTSCGFNEGEEEGEDGEATTRRETTPVPLQISSE